MNTHNPNDAIRIATEEPVAKNDYKTLDRNWFDPQIPKAPRTINIKFKKMSETAKIPTAIRDGDIGFDIYCDEDFTIKSGQTKKIKTNIQLADMPIMDNDRNRIFMKIEGRSGLSVSGIFPTGGVIDPTYKGEICVVLNCLNFNYNDFSLSPGTIQTFKKGERIAQLVVYKVATMGEVVMEETDIVTESIRGQQGFGSSGK